MATLAPSDIQQLIDAAVKGAIQGQQKSRQGGSLDGGYFQRVDKFNGKEGTCQEWSFQFKTQVGAASKFTRDKLDEIQKADAEPDYEDIFLKDTEEMADKFGAEL